MKLYRRLDNIPVLAKEGGILPMADSETVGNGADNPEKMTVKIFPGKNGEFSLYEDDGISEEEGDKGFGITRMCWDYEGEGVFTVFPVSGNPEFVPEKRSYTLEFYCIGKKKLTLLVNGRKRKFSGRRRKESSRYEPPGFPEGTGWKYAFWNRCP